MITLAMATEIAAPCAEVWRRLADPEEVARWRPGATRPARLEGVWPRPGAELRLRAVIREVPVELRDRVLEAVPGRRLRCAVRLGLYRFEATFTLTPEREGSGTRVGLRVVTESETPLVGGALDRFAVRRLATDLAASWLRALRDLCEGSASTAEGGARSEPKASEVEELKPTSGPPRRTSPATGPASASTAEGGARSEPKASEVEQRKPTCGTAFGSSPPGRLAPPTTAEGGARSEPKASEVEELKPTCDRAPGSSPPRRPAAPTTAEGGARSEPKASEVEQREPTRQTSPPVPAET